MAAEASKQDLPPETDVCGTWLEYTDRNCSRQLGVFDRFDWTEEIFESFAGRVIEVHRELRADNKGYQMLSIHDLETTNQAHDWLKPVIDSGAVVPGAAGPSSSVSAPTTPTSGGAGTGPANTTVSDEGKVLILCLGKEWQKGRNLVSQLARVDMQKASRGRNFRADLSRFYGPELPTPEGATLPIATCRSLGWRWKYHLEALNIWIVDWLYFPATKTTLVVLRRDATVTWRETRYLFECFFSQYRAFRLANPLVFGLIILKRLEWINQRIMESRINDINDVLRQTGFHGFRNLEVNNKTLTRKDLSTLTAKVLTTGTMLDCLIGDIKTFQEHDIMMKREIEEWRRDSRAGRGNYAGRPSSSSSASASGTPPPDNNMALVKAKTPVAALPLTVVEEEASDENLSSYLLEECDAVWRLRRGVENIGMDYEGRARLLLTALQSMITQQDQKLTISLAQASWKDTTSMTAITIITMVFLPGTFMSVCLNHLHPPPFPHAKSSNETTS